MRRAIGLVLILTAACSDRPTGPTEPMRLVHTPLAAAQPTTLKLDLPIQFNAWACVETVSLQGKLLAVIHTNSTDNGQHAKALFLQRLTGQGQLTGDKYEAIGNSVSVGNISADTASTDTEVFSFRLVSRAASFQAKMRTHTTVNANGDLTAEVQDFSVDCRVH
jgi:hypothetical protein